MFKRLARHLKSTSDAFVRTPIPKLDGPVGYVYSDWASPVAKYLLTELVIAILFGTAELKAIKTVLEFFVTKPTPRSNSTPLRRRGSPGRFGRGFIELETVTSDDNLADPGGRPSEFTVWRNLEFVVALL